MSQQEITPYRVEEMFPILFLLVCLSTDVNADWNGVEMVNRIEMQLENLKSRLQRTNEGKCEATKYTVRSTYVRWGRNDCPGESNKVYDGYMAGKKQNKVGGGANFLCMTKTPKYTNLRSPNIEKNLYGTETDISGFSPSIANKDATCAVCSIKRSSVLMVPGQMSCPSGWKVEYWGYLMSEGTGTYLQPTNYVCVDHKPIGVPGGDKNNDDSVIYLVGGMCGSLKCPPYKDGKPLTCVVYSQ